MKNDDDAVEKGWMHNDEWIERTNGNGLQLAKRDKDSRLFDMHSVTMNAKGTVLILSLAKKNSLIGNMKNKKIIILLISLFTVLLIIADMSIVSNRQKHLTIKPKLEVSFHEEIKVQKESNEKKIENEIAIDVVIIKSETNSKETISEPATSAQITPNITDYKLEDDSTPSQGFDLLMFTPQPFSFESINSTKPYGIFLYNNKEYESIITREFPDYHRYRNRIQYPQVAFDEKGYGRDITLMFEDKEEFKLFWREPDFTKGVRGYAYKHIPCDHFGVKSCVVTHDRRFHYKADAVVQLASFRNNPRPTVMLRPTQAYIGYYVEAENRGCTKKAFDARLSQGISSTIKLNAHCNTVKMMYRCMRKAIKMVSVRPQLTIEERLSWKRKIYQYCVVYPDTNEEVVEDEAFRIPIIKPLDVITFVGECTAPQSRFIGVLLNMTIENSSFSFSSHGYCYNNKPPSGDRIGDASKHKFVLAIENKMRQDLVSEKIFQAFETGAVPIYQGAPNIYDYAPNGSFVGMYSFAEPEEIESYIKYLKENETAYNQFFDWDFDEWIEKPHTLQCLQLETSVGLDVGWCSVCDWVANVFPIMKREKKKNCDTNDYAPYFGYPRYPFKFMNKLNAP